MAGLRTLGAAALGLTVLAGCADLRDAVNAEPPAVARGRADARLRCASCHAVTSTGESPDLRAPRFASIRLRFNELSLERELRAIGEVGHYGMPPTPTEEDERRDLIAYIETVK